jgi:serine/threonine-protein kinase
LEPADLRGQPVTIGRYVLHRQIARGGMATIHIARLLGDEGFSRIVAAKRLHAEFAEDSEFVAMFLDEARIASKVHHQNVVPVLDVVTAGDEVILVQEYVHGAPLQWLLRSMAQSKQQMPVSVAVSIACDVLAGLHATHETVDELGQPMQIIHRDVSPQNVMISIDGSARLLDFGVAKAIMAAHVTREGTYKGKLAYSAPEQLRGQATAQSDVYSLSVLLWELLVGHRMHRAKSGAELVSAVLNGMLPTINEALCAEHTWESISASDRRQLQVLEPIVRKGLAADTRERWASAAQMEEALAFAVKPASAGVVAAWLKTVGKDFLQRRDGLIAAEEASWRKLHPVGSGRTTSSAAPRNSSVNLRVPGATNSRQTILSAPPERPSWKVFALVGFAVLALVAAILTRRSLSTTAVRVDAAAPPAVPAALPRSVPAQVAPAPVSAPKETPPVEAQTGRAAGDSEPSARSAVVPVKESRPSRRQHSAPARAAPEPETEAPASSPTPRQANDCSIPYYFDGSKKIFKPSCI